MKDNQHRRTGSKVPVTKTAGLTAATVLIGAMSAQMVFAAGEVVSVNTGSALTSPYSYDINGVKFTWGTRRNEVMESFDYNGNTYSYVIAADRVDIQRVDRPGVTSGQPCAVFAERDEDYTRLQPDYPRNPAAGLQCDISRMLTDRVVNRGVLNIFSNTGPEPKNVERVDFVFSQGVVAPLQSDLLNASGHIVSEKRGNNRVQVAAILSLDDSGQPASYGPLVLVKEAGCQDPDICYGITSVKHNYSFFRTNAVGEQGEAFHFGDSSETMAVAFVSLADLGVQAEQRYYGVSYFARDVIDGKHTLTDPSSFPADSNDDYITEGDGADIYGGVAGYFVPQSSSTANGSAFADVNSNGIRDEGEAGLPNVSLTLYNDTNANGILDEGDQQVGPEFMTNTGGDFQIAGIPAGQYFLQVDENDPDLPPGAVLSDGSNPVSITAPVNADDAINFAFELTGNSNSDGEGGPTLVDDTFIIEQDIPTVIDVLANDIDPTGTGLTITSVAGVENGTVDINADGTLTFTPAPGFTGDTGFLYVVQDGNGDEATGMVTASVVRFSDINNNGINDFLECGCTDVGLITGIHGAGVGGAAGSLLIMVPAMLWYRRRKSSGVPASMVSGAAQ
ncbi:MAG: cadherin-like domain-containing protein [Granulosicoccus sp.]|nr:cadherin-like domain-containing protein [Granulosicoccus sp.]